MALVEARAHRSIESGAEIAPTKDGWRLGGGRDLHRCGCGIITFSFAEVSTAGFWDSTACRRGSLMCRFLLLLFRLRLAAGEHPLCSIFQLALVIAHASVLPPLAPEIFLLASYVLHSLEAFLYTIEVLRSRLPINYNQLLWHPRYDETVFD